MEQAPCRVRRRPRRLLPQACALLALLLIAASAAAQPQPGAAADDPAELLDAFAFRHIGPIGNRVSAVSGVPGDPRTWYAGAASGGLWRSPDGGTGWEPIFDREDAASIGAIAVAPSDPNVVWVGTGESFIRSNISIGNGVYRSTDRGDSFKHLGLDLTGRIGRILVHPNDPDTALIAALGHAYGPQDRDEAARGVFRTDRRRRHLGARPLHQCGHRRDRPRLCARQPADRLRRGLADRDSHLRPHQRRPGKRHLPFHGRWRHLGAA